MYHDIPASRVSASRLAVPVDVFAAQLEYLHSEGFETLNASTVAVALANGARLPERAVVITYDDGFADVHERALPLLSRYNFTATVYVTTEWIQDVKSTCSGPRPGRMLNWQQIRELVDVGFEIGAHSCSHPELDQLPMQRLETELRLSKSTLEDELQCQILGMAYPFGYSDARVRQLVRSLGYGYACAVGNRLIDPAFDLFALPRLTVKRTTSLRNFQQVANGLNVNAVYMSDRTLTRGWALVRHSRKVWKSPRLRN